MVNHPRRSRAKASLGASTGLASIDVIDLTRGHDHDADWADLLKAVQVNFENTLISNGYQLFTTDAALLLPKYLDNLPGERQVHNCRTCKRFFDAFGGLVAIDDAGRTLPALWNAATRPFPAFYQASMGALWSAVAKAKVTGVFYHEQVALGTGHDGEWSHLSAFLPYQMVHRNPLKTVYQAIAAKIEDFKTLSTAMDEFKTPLLAEALRVLEADAVNRAEKFVGPVRWLLTLRSLLDVARGKTADNILWKWTAAAPAGFCHPRSGVIGSLLEDIAAGKRFETVRRNFNEKTKSTDYQRPKAAPSAGTIQTAERIFDRLDLTLSLERRFARLEDVDVVWRPKHSYPPQPTGTFGHLRPLTTPAATPLLNLPPVTITWEKFARTVLMNAQKIEQNVPDFGHFVALTAPVHPVAKPLFKWDDGVNPIAWYVYPDGSFSRQWNLPPGWTTVTAVANFPTMRKMPELATGVVLTLEKAVDTRNKILALFPECMRSELHEVRSVIDAHQKTRKLAGMAQATACGYDVRKTAGAIDVHLRVFNGTAWTQYNIDRWD